MATYVLAVNTTGGAGVSAGNTQTAFEVRGWIDSIFYDYNGAPATTDTTVSEVGGANQTIQTLTNTNADVIKYPVRQNHDNAGTAVAASYDKFYVNGKLKVAVAQSNDLTPSVTVTITVIEDENSV